MSKTRSQQRGAALILLVFVIAIAMTTYLIRTLNSEGLEAEREQVTIRNLAVAKEALISWAVSNSFNPGQLPYPDRLETTTPIYDGRGDCGGNPISNPILLLGQLPIYGSDGCVSPTEGLGIDAEDGYGNRLWYAVSANLLHNYAPTGGELSNPKINPNLINTTTGWLSVRDGNGAVVSNRAAAVIIAPGNPIGNQSRSNTATANNFLDSFQKSGTTYSNFDYDQDFVMGGSSDRVDDNDASYTRPYLFNDQLVYITIDELMEALEKRIAREVVASLNSYYLASGPVANRFYPYAAVGDSCTDNQLYGRLPTVPTPPVNCATPDLLSELPVWFVPNDWEDFIFYTTSSSTSLCTPSCGTGTITVGSEVGVDALVISTGAALSGQTRPSFSLSDYLDSVENADTNTIYDAVGTPLTSAYNDQMFIVAP